MGHLAYIRLAGLVSFLGLASVCSADVTQESLIAQTLPLYTTVDDPALHVTSADGTFDSVVKLTISRSNGIATCTGALLNNGRDILTAAHCLTDENGNLTATGGFVLFQTQYGSDTLSANSFTVHPDWTGNAGAGSDLAIIHLGESAPYGAFGYEIYRSTDEVGQTVTRAGYGLSGTGDTGTTLPSGTKRDGLNRYDVLGDVFHGVLDSSPLSGAQLAYDFDNGTVSHDAFEFFGRTLGTRNINDLGLGTDEVMAAPGDSGGPAFINGQIAGVTSFLLRLSNSLGQSSDIDDELNSSFGEFGFDTRVSYFADWIDANLSEPPPFIAGDLNSDGFVGLDDLDLVLNRWNQTLDISSLMGGDATGDSYVGLDDLDIVLNNWGAGTPPMEKATIPEPAAVTLILIGSNILLSRRH